MKILIVLFIILFSVTAQASNSCSIKGTQVVYTNGFFTSRKAALHETAKIHSITNYSNFDDSGEIPPPVLAYNYDEEDAYEIFEALVQKIPVEFLEFMRIIDPYGAFLFFITEEGEYFDTLFPGKTGQFIATFLKWNSDALQRYRYDSKFRESEVEVKLRYERAFNAGYRVLAVSHSQGSLFMESAYNELAYLKKSQHFAGFQIATLTDDTAIPKHGYATHSRDYMVEFFDENFEVLDPNIDAPFLLNSGPGGDWEFFLKHGLLSTYLFDSNISSKVINYLHTTASLLDSNCPKAYIDFLQTTEELTATFTSFDPEYPNLRDVLYVWDFGDGNLETTELKTITHTYEKPGKYTVILIITNKAGRILGDDAIVEKDIEIGNLIQGCHNDGILGKYHINPDGSIGGFVENTATVADTVYIGPYTNICGTSQVLGNSRISSPSVSISGGPNLVRDSLIIDSVIQTSNHLEITYSTISGLTVSPIVYSVLVEDSRISNSNFTNTDYIMVTYNSTINDSSFQGDNVVVQLQAVINSMTFNLESQLSVYGTSVYYEDRSGTLADWPF